MYSVNAYIENPSLAPANISQLSIRRDWMGSETYNCDPVTLANTLGYGISFPVDISFIWDGKLWEPGYGILGKEYIWSGRPDGTVSLITNLIFKTDENTSLLTTSVPNQFVKEYEAISTIISTSFFANVFSVVLKINEDYVGKEIFIPANTNVACILPISIKQFDDSVIKINNSAFPYEKIHGNQDYINALHKGRDEGKRLKLYRSGKDHMGNIIGKHEVIKLKLNVEK